MEVKININENPAVDIGTLENMRERFDLEPDDECLDEAILQMDNRLFFKHLLEWEGLIGYTDFILEMIEMAYGIDLTDWPFDTVKYKRELED